jgi:hypothetical protein
MIFPNDQTDARLAKIICFIVLKKKGGYDKCDLLKLNINYP